MAAIAMAALIFAAIGINALVGVNLPIRTETDAHRSTTHLIGQSHRKIIRPLGNRLRGDPKRFGQIALAAK